MKRSSYLIYFTSLVLLAMAFMTAGCSQSGERLDETGENANPVVIEEPIDTKTIMLPGDVPLEMVWIPPGSFMMGSPEDEQDRFEHEGPQHEVTITEGFWMGKYTITQAQWEAVVGSNPSVHSGPNRPVDRVSWNDIYEAGGFLNHLNTLYSDYYFRLPREAEWEYAARAGTTTRFYWGDDLDYSKIDAYAWYSGNNSPSGTKDVGLKLPNAWGLYDMSGNIWEWCEDNWHWDYNGAPNDGSAWVDSIPREPRILRGGDNYSKAMICRSSSRYMAGGSYAYSFRIVMTP